MFGHAKQTQVDALIGTITLLRERVEKLEANVGVPTKSSTSTKGKESAEFGSRSWRAIRYAAEEASRKDAMIQPDSAAQLEKRIEEKNNA